MSWSLHATATSFLYQRPFFPGLRKSGMPQKLKVILLINFIRASSAPKINLYVQYLLYLGLGTYRTSLSTTCMLCNDASATKISLPAPPSIFPRPQQFLGESLLNTGKSFSFLPRIVVHSVIAFPFHLHTFYIMHVDLLEGVRGFVHDLPPGSRFFMRMDMVMVQLEVTIYDATRQHDSRVRRLFDTNMDMTCPFYTRIINE